MHEYLGGDSTDVVFVGNSLTEGFPLQKMFRDPRVKNRGVSGSTSADILARAAGIASRHLRKVFLMVGINDILYGVPEADTRRNVAGIVSAIRRASPRTEIFVQSILPVSDPKRTATVSRYNGWLSAYASSRGLPFIDIFPLLLKDGRLDDSLTYDGTHLRVRAYAIWKGAVERYARK